MPPCLWHNWILLWMTIASWSSMAMSSDISAYGMRIRPLNRIASQDLSCPACQNKTSNLQPNLYRTEGNANHHSAIKKLNTDSKPKISNFYHTVKPLTKTQQTASPTYSEIPKDNNKRGATFFFTQVEPHRFEYRAMFQHHRNIESNVFQPFADFDAFGKEFPPLPKFPTFPELPDFFSEHKDPFPEQKDPFPEHKDPFPKYDPFPNINEFSFPTLPPSIKRAWQPPSEVIPQRPALDEKFENPIVKNYDIVLGHTHYPKIFRFNEERINIEEFDKQKKLRFYSLGKTEQNELLEPENVKRNQLLILHGGIFTVKEPPLFNKHQHVKKRRKLNGFRPFRRSL